MLEKAKNQKLDQSGGLEMEVRKGTETLKALCDDLIEILMPQQMPTSVSLDCKLIRSEDD